MNASHSRSSIVLARPLRAASLLLALGSAAACTAILAPRDDVQRCGNADDCDAIDDKRYTPECKFDDANADLDTTKTDKICVATYNKQINCNPDGYQSAMGGEHPYWVTFGKSACAELTCPEEDQGKRGCPTLDGACLEGQGTPQSFGETTFCGEDGDVPGYALNDELEGQHVKDQFCKSFFCDEDFVCNNDTGKCIPCDPDEAYGEGGCGTVYSNGAPAAVYVLGDALEEQCAEADASTDEPLFGAC